MSRRLVVLAEPAVFRCVVLPARDELLCPDALICQPEAAESRVVQALADLQRAWLSTRPEERVRIEAAVGQLRRLCAAWGRVACSERVLTRDLSPELGRLLLDATAILVSHYPPRYLGPDGARRYRRDHRSPK